ncbi:hypothetical protein LO762_13810 [Actinocorallia sp. API 0066]|uniref:hypothetical protein n=1 Tax=Actinocorallia sp. API 0066 TaxID=2896846 RepID=UPI001E316199|nr:hypothetical protein [Actinocorallia sp. API 0066]MCD0450260.1 hypothetical protein [Actinocorallia sp. API 0066]
MVSRKAARRGFGRDLEQIVWWLGFAALVVIGVYTWNWRLLLLTLLLWSFYEICLVRTRCRVKTRQGNECIEQVRGRVFAHDKRHQGIKNDGLWQLIGRTNPSYRPPVSDPNRATGVVLVAPKVRHRLSQEDRYILYAAFVGLVVSLVGMLWGLF